MPPRLIKKPCSYFPKMWRPPRVSAPPALRRRIKPERRRRRKNGGRELHPRWGQAKEPRKNRQIQPPRRMDQGKEAMKNRQFTAAAQDFDSALRLIPEDAAAAKALREARAAADAQQAAQKRRRTMKAT